MQIFLDILLRPEAVSQLESISLAGLASNRRVLKAIQLCPVRSSVINGGLSRSYTYELLASAWSCKKVLYASFHMKVPDHCYMCCQKSLKLWYLSALILAALGLGYASSNLKTLSLWSHLSRCSLHLQQTKPTPVQAWLDIAIL